MVLGLIIKTCTLYQFLNTTLNVDVIFENIKTIGSSWMSPKSVTKKRVSFSTILTNNKYVKHHMLNNSYKQLMQMNCTCTIGKKSREFRNYTNSTILAKLHICIYKCNGLVSKNLLHCANK